MSATSIATIAEITGATRMRSCRPSLSSVENHQRRNGPRRARACARGSLSRRVIRQKRSAAQPLPRVQWSLSGRPERAVGGGRGVKVAGRYASASLPRSRDPLKTLGSQWRRMGDSNSRFLRGEWPVLPRNSAVFGMSPLTVPDMFLHRSARRVAG